MTDQHELESIMAAILHMTPEQVVELADKLDHIMCSSVGYGDVSIKVKRGKIYQINMTQEGKVLWGKDNNK